MDQPEILLMEMASWLPQELMDTDDDSDDEDDGAAAAEDDGEEQMTLLQLAHVSGCGVRHTWAPCKAVLQLVWAGLLPHLAVSS
jgi:hypothetical protein